MYAAGPLWAPLALVARVSCGPPGPLWAGPLLVGQALVAPPGRLWAGPLWPPWAFMGLVLMGPLGPYGPGLRGTLVNQRLRSMANPLNVLAILKWYTAI